MRGIILTNAFYNSEEVEYQPKRLQAEFATLGVKVDIIKNDCFPFFIAKSNINYSFDNYDFCIFFDKDEYLLRCLEKLNKKVFNNPAAIITCDDKMRTCIALSNNGIPIPKTLPAFLCYDKNANMSTTSLKTIENELSYPFIVKKSCGSLGAGVYLVRDRDEFLSVYDKIKCERHIYQEYLDSQTGIDVRAIVIGGKYVGAIKRKGADYRSNVSLGGDATVYTLDANTILLVEKIAKVLNLDYCGVDLLYDKNGFSVCEVNSNAFFKEFEKVTHINVAKIYAEHILSQFTN